MELFLLFASISALFFVLLVVKSVVQKVFKKDFCVICASISLTWLSLLILYKLSLFKNGLVIALLIGCSVVGIFYAVEKKVSEKFKLFKLPFLLSMIFIAFSLLSLPDDFVKILIFLLVLWLLFITTFFYSNNDKVHSVVEKIIECCKW